LSQELHFCLPQLCFQTICVAHQGRFAIFLVPQSVLLAWPFVTALQLNLHPTLVTFGLEIFTKADIRRNTNQLVDPNQLCFTLVFSYLWCGGQFVISDQFLIRKALSAGIAQLFCKLMRGGKLCALRGRPIETVLRLKFGGQPIRCPFKPASDGFPY
jgi:hypothetical protein